MFLNGGPCSVFDTERGSEPYKRAWQKPDRQPKIKTFGVICLDCRQGELPEKGAQNGNHNSFSTLRFGLGVWDNIGGGKNS